MSALLQAHLGEVAAFGAALCWTTCSVAFTRAGRHIGSLSVNLIRLLIAGGLLSLVGAVFFREVVPSAPTGAWGYLALSGLIGFFLGDLCLFKSYLMIGPRLGLLVLSLWPPIAALLAWPLLGEQLVGMQWAGMALALAGVVMVVVERPGKASASVAVALTHDPRGIALAAMGALCQAAGYVVSKPGMKLMDPEEVMPVQVSLQATQMRLLAALVGFAVVFTVTRRWGRLRDALGHRQAMAWLGFGALAGPFLGVALSLYAMLHTQAGVAAMIMATAPILILPYAILVEKEKIKPLALLGTMVAFVGLALLTVGK